MMEESNKTNWKWKPRRWWLGLILFWFISTVGAGIIARSGGSDSQESGFIIVIMLIFAILAACTDRNWRIPKRIFWVIGVWIIHAFLIIPAGLIAVLISKPHLVERTTSLLAAFPLVIWAMRRSKFFVEPDRDKLEIFWFDFLTYFKNHYPDYKSNIVESYRNYLRDRQASWKDVLSEKEMNVMTQIIEKFFIKDNIDYEVFYQKYYEKYDAFNVSPYWPRWFFALYPEVIDFFSNFIKDMRTYGIPPKSASQYFQDFLRKENINFDINSEFSIENLYKIKETWKKIHKEIENE